MGKLDPNVAPRTKTPKDDTDLRTARSSAESARADFITLQRAVIALRIAGKDVSDDQQAALMEASERATVAAKAWARLVAAC